LHADLSTQDAHAASEVLFDAVFDAARRHKCSTAALFTYPGYAGDYRRDGIGAAVKHTPVLDLRDRSAEQLRSIFQRRTRQYIDAAIKDGVHVLLGGQDDLAMHRNMQIAFVGERNLPLRRVNSLSQMEKVWDTLASAGEIVMYKAMIGDMCVGTGGCPESC
jgi:hypothetical protein